MTRSLRAISFVAKRRQAATQGLANGKAARAAVAAGVEANNYLEDAEFKALLAQLDAPDGETFDTSEQVVAPGFGAPLRATHSSAKPSQETVIPEEFYRNMDTTIDDLSDSLHQLLGQEVDHDG